MRIILFFLTLLLLDLGCFNKENNKEIQSVKLSDVSIRRKKYPNNGSRLIGSYSDFIDSISNNFVYFKNGNRLEYTNKINKLTFDDSLNYASISDMFAQEYIKGRNYKIPIPTNFDPGRIRNDNFFKQIYGRTKSEVIKNLRTIDWFGRNILVNKNNEVLKKLLLVKNELDKLPFQYRKYFISTGGTFNWRPIAGTTRQSAHSFGIAIDLNTKFSHYWRNAKPNKNGIYIYKNCMPLEIVEIFEKYGFIWGGKWYHYDTMHFEYRPELLD